MALAGASSTSCNTLALHRDIERGGRLVGNDEARIAGKRHRDQDALPHPAGDFVRIKLQHPPRFTDRDLGEKLDRTLQRGTFRQRQMMPKHDRNLRPDPLDRIERGHRILADQRGCGGPTDCVAPAPPSPRDRGPRIESYLGQSRRSPATGRARHARASICRRRIRRPVPSPRPAPTSRLAPRSTLVALPRRPIATCKSWTARTAVIFAAPGRARPAGHRREG